MKGKLYGAFNYDLYPYFVCFEIDEVNEDGYYVKGVGTFRPEAVIALLPVKEGKKVEILKDEMKYADRKNTDEHRAAGIANLIKQVPLMKKLEKYK